MKRTMLTYQEAKKANELTKQILNLSSISELNYFDIDNVIALSLCVNEVVARRSLLEEATEYWDKVCDFFLEENIYDAIYIQLDENSTDGEFDICNPLDVSDAALFVMLYVRKKLELERAGYFDISIAYAVSDIVFDWQYTHPIEE